MAETAVVFAFKSFDDRDYQIVRTDDVPRTRYMLSRATRKRFPYMLLDADGLIVNGVSVRDLEYYRTRYGPVNA